MKHTIEIEGLPVGWEPVAYRKPIFGEYYFYNDDIVQGKTGCGQFLIVKRKQPHRIVLEEAESNINVDFYYKCKWWRIVEDSGENND